SEDDAPEAESAGRGLCPVAGRAPSGERRPDVLFVHVSLAGLQEDGDHPPDHAPEEGVRPDVDRHEHSLPPDPDRMDGPARRPILEDRPEGAEVVPADEGLPGSLHRGDVERGPDPERLTLADRASRPGPDRAAALPAPRRRDGVASRPRTP